MDQTHLLPWVGWQRSYVPIHVVDAPQDGVSLRRLGETEGLASMVDAIATGFAVDRLYATLTALHYAVGATSLLLIAPFALDGVILDASPDDLGIMLDSSASLSGLRVHAGLEPLSDASPARLGASLRAALTPLCEVATTLSGTPSRAVTLIVMDALDRACRRLERAPDCRAKPGWVDALLAAMADPDRPARRSFQVTADAGPPIAMAIPRVCCVLATGPDDHACPTCPQRSPDDRRQTTEAWLRSLDDEAFLAETGRAPVRAKT